MTTTSRRDSAPLAVLAAATGLVALGIAVWWGVWRGGWVFDDHTAIERNAALIAGDWWNAAFGTEHQPLANRPLACLSLATDFAVFGQSPFGPHLVNLMLHLGNAVLLLLLVRRSLLAPNLGSRFDEPRALRFAAVVAGLWMVHPVTVEAVAYATQRSTLLAAGFLLLSLWATLRAHGARRPLGFRIVVWLALACAMASKEDLVVGPVLVALFERAFLLPTWASLRARWRWLATLATTWTVVGACLWLGPANPTVGYSVPPFVTAPQWLMTQAGVVLHYVVQVLWPGGLRTYYDQGIVREFGRAVMPGLAVIALLAASLACWRTRPWWGWLGALFFLLLAPTSSILPIVTELVAERRIYLPMLAVLVPVLFAVDGLRRMASPRTAKLGPVLAGAAIVALALSTRVRIGAYADETAFWADAFAKLDPGSRTAQAAGILTNQAAVLKRQGRSAESDALLDTAMLCEDMSEATVVQHALSLLPRGQHEQAVANMREVVRRGGSINTFAVLGICLASAHTAAGAGPDDPRLAEADACLRRAIAGGVAGAREWLWLGNVSLAAGNLAEAEKAFAACGQLRPDATEPRLGLAEILVRRGHVADGRQLATEVLAGSPGDVAQRLRFAALLGDAGDLAGAEQLAQQVLAVDPANAAAQRLLARARQSR